MKILALIIFSFLNFYSCKNEEKITTLLKSENKEDIILGAFLAGETENKMYIPYLLKDCGNPSLSINIKFKGISVYQSKMNALKKITKINPPNPITRDVDSVNIKFYFKMFEN